jgi:hypothetical protein
LVCAAVHASNSDGFVQISEEAFHADGLVVTGLVVTARGGVEPNPEESASIRENATESTTSVHDDKAAHADFQEDLLEQDPGQLVSMNVVGGNADYELSQVAHSREEVAVAGLSDGGTRTPKVAMQDEHRGCDGPAIEDLTVATDAFVR